jgi:hypothetical protein
MTKQTRTDFRNISGFLNLLISRALPTTSTAVTVLTTQLGSSHLHVSTRRLTMKPFVKPAILFAIATVIYPVAAHATDIVSTSCIVQNISITTSNLPFDQPRLTVTCSSVVPSSNITYFAFPLLASDSELSPASQGPLFQTLTTLLSAHGGAGRVLTISYDLSDASGNSWGCGSANCRIILNVDAF